jgi:hypothetical protein
MRECGWILMLALLVVFVRPAAAQVHFGPQLSLGSDSDFGVGGRFDFPLRTGALGMDGAIDSNYFFGGGSAVDSWIDVNANLRVPVPLARDFTTRIGAGLNVTFISLESPSPGTSTDTEFGFNLLGAVGLPRGRLAPFAEFRVVIGGAEQVVMTGGFTVGPRR